MLASYGESCSECSGDVVDLGDELVCRSCGVVTSKEVVEERDGGPPQAIDYTGQALGGYLGPIEYGPKEKFCRGLTSSPSSFRYLKLVSDYAGREDSTVYSCVKLIERVCEKLALPKIVMGQAVVIAKKLFDFKRKEFGISSAALSAYAIITACKIENVTSVGVREVVQAHRLLGRRVRVSSLIRLSIDSPFKMGARRAEDYVARVVGRLSAQGDLERTLMEERVNAAAYFAELREAALEALGRLAESGRGGHSPCALAATSVYAGEVLLSRKDSRRRRLTQREVAECVDIAEYTVREQFGVLFRPAMAEEATRPSPPPQLKS